MSDVGWSDVGFWHWLWPCPGTGSGPVLALFWPCPCPSLALQGHPYMHSSHPGHRAHLGSTSGTPATPGTPPGTTAPSTVISVHPAAPAPATPPWGSLWAAPMVRLAEHVSWPVKWPCVTPLNGTPCHAPRVTRHPAITASSVMYTLPWSTLWP